MVRTQALITKFSVAWLITPLSPNTIRVTKIFKEILPYNNPVALGAS